MLRFILSICCCLTAADIGAQTLTNTGLHPIKIDYKWGFMDASGALRIDAIYDNVDDFTNEGMSIVRKDGLLGIIDTNGNPIIPSQYELIQILDKDLFLVRNQNRWEIRNLKNQLVLNDASGKIELMENGYLTYETINGRGLAHIHRGKLVDPIYQNFKHSNNNNFLIVESFNNKKGLIDSLGNFLLPIEYDEVQCAQNCMLVKKDRKWGVCTITGQALLAPEWDNFRFIDTELLELTRIETHYLYSLTENRFILQKYATVEKFPENRLLFAINVGYMGLMDKQGQLLLANRYNDIQPFSDRLFRVQSAETENWGLSTLGDTIIAPMDYDYIGTLSNTVAVIKDNGKSGIINFKGEIVMNIIYPELPLKDNSIKIKDPETGLKMFVFNEEGYLEEQTNYANFKSLRVKNRTADASSSNGTTGINDPRQRRELNDSLVWMRARNGKFGIYNLNLARFVIPPDYSSYINYPELDISIAEVRKFELGGTLPLNYVEVSINSTFGIFSNKIGKPITKTEFIDLKMSDIVNDSLPVARVVFVGGKHGLIDTRGKVVLRGMAFIDAFKEGKARCSKKGALAIDVKGKHPRNLGQALPYLNRLLASYSIENASTDTKLPNGVLYLDYAEWGFINTAGQWVIGTQYDFVEPFSGETAMVYKNKKWGLIDNTGQVLVPLEYDDMNYIPNSDNRLLYITKHQRRFGCIDADAKIVVPVDYDKVGQFKEGLVAVRRGNRWGFVNEQGVEVVPCMYRQVHDYQEGLAAVMEKGRWGFIDKNGNTVLKAQYAQVGNFKEGIAWVQSRGGYIEYITPSGEVVLVGKYSMANDFEEGIARVRAGIKGWALIDRQGNLIMKPKKSYKAINAFNQYGLAIVKIGTKYALLNREGKLVTKGKFAQIDAFREGYAVVRRHGYSKFMLFKNVKYAIMDSTGSLVTRPIFRQLRDFNNGRAAFCGDEGWGFVDTNGAIVTAPEYMKVSDFKAGRAVVYLKHNETGLIDTNGQYIVSPKVNKILEVSEKLALVKESYGNYYFLHEDLQRHTPNNFQAAHCFNDGAAPVCTNGRWGVINNQGLQMMTAKYSEIDAYEGGIALVKLYSSQGVVNQKGEIIIPPLYEYINYAGEGIFRIEQGDKMGYLGIDGNWVWEMRQ